MPTSLNSLFPQALTQLEFTRSFMQTALSLTKLSQASMGTAFDMADSQHSKAFSMVRGFSESQKWVGGTHFLPLLDLYQQQIQIWRKLIEGQSLAWYGKAAQTLESDLKFIDFLLEKPPEQDWAFDTSNVLMDLPGLRLIDISLSGNHAIQNYTVVFAPRAGHHSNIAEKTVLYLREQGLTRIAVVEQKCADDIPLQVDGKRHFENFESQVNQYRQVLTLLKEKTDVPPHLVAICQPGPLLLATLIRYPKLGKTFGSAGSPMHTEAEPGFLTDFARLMGKGYIDILLNLFPSTTPSNKKGAGREAYDGRMHVLGFYLLGLDQHAQNYKALFHALRDGDDQAAERQMDFYHWYNTVHHLPAGFIRDTYQKIFVGNDLIRGKLKIAGKLIRLEDYPANVPIWALGGDRDNIAPPLQATSHIDLIKTVPDDQKLSLICNGGHMGLFRSGKILEKYYSRIADFLLAHSDMA